MNFGENAEKATNNDDKINLYNTAADLYNTAYNDFVNIINTKKVPPTLRMAAETEKAKGDVVNAFKPTDPNNQTQPGGGKRSTVSKRQKKRKTIKHRRRQQNNH